MTCHSTDGSRGVGPTWKGLTASEVTLADGQRIARDRAYLRRAIADPDSEIVAGYANGVMAGAMPGKTLSATEVEALVLFLESLSDQVLLMNHFSRTIAAICSLALVCCASNPSLPHGATPTAPGILAPAGSDPTVAVNTETGTRYAVWIRPAKDSNQLVVARSDEGQNFTDPVVASGSDTDIVSATLSPAQVAVGPKGEVYVLYERRIASGIFEPGRSIPRLARSKDGGQNFEAAVDVAAADGVETSAESSGLAVASDGAVIVAWLDHREAFARAKLPHDQRSEDKRWLDSDDPEVDVRLSRSTDGGRNFGPSVLVADGASKRSRIALKFSPDGRHYDAWRAKLNQFKGSYDAVRDVLVAFSGDGGLSWSSPLKVHDDRFKAGDCPQITWAWTAIATGACMSLGTGVPVSGLGSPKITA
ncbi:MAG: hypothetical protein ACRERU_08860 [Methylococcales bacterium]